MKRMYTPKTLCAAFLLALSLSSFAQTVPVSWTRNYNGPPDNTDDAADMVIDAAENVYVTGTSYGVNGNFDIATIKYNSSGAQQWVATFNGTGNDNDVASAVCTDANGNVYVTGKSRGSSTYEDVVTIKYNSGGIQQWVAFYNGSDSLQDEGAAVYADASGNVYVTGYASISGNMHDIVTIKYDANGNQQWVQLFNGTGGGNDEGKDIGVDAGGNVYVTGKGNETTFSTLSDIVTIKYDNAGNQQWVMAYDGGNDNDYGKALTLDDNGNVIVTGYSFLSGNWFDYATIKYNPSGAQQWASRYNNGSSGSNRYDEPWDVVADSLGNVYVTGQSQAAGGNGAPPDFATVKYNSGGTQQWAQRYNGTANNDDRGYAIALDDSLNVYVTGYTSLTTANRNYATIKYSNAGVQQWIATYEGTGTGHDNALAIAVSPARYVYVSGISDVDPTSGTNDDYLTIKYAPQSIGFADLYGQRFALLLFPNPADNGATVSITSGFISPGSELWLSVTDLAGKEIISGKELSCGSQYATYTFGREDLQAGAYLIRVYDRENNFVGSGKLIVK
ncbi:MAG: SBBP repeat-containing protein [Bacteroidota bacterium]